MKFIKSALLVLGVGIIFSGFSPYALADQYVNGYFRSNGTYVDGYWRSSPDSSPYNNFSYPGNTNPYTGVTAGGNSNTYLNNYYKNSSGFSFPTYNSSFTIPSYTPTYTGYSGLSSDDIYKEVSGGWKSYGVLYCDSGYYEKGNKCIKEPENGYAIGTTIYCDSGYIEKNGKCIEPKNGYVVGSTLYCDDGYFIANNSCSTIEKICKAEFGSKSVPYGEDKCACKDGFKWNTKQTKCVIDRSVN